MLSRSYDQPLTNKKLRNSTSAGTSIKKVDDSFTANSKKSKKLLPAGDQTSAKSNVSRGSKSIYTEKEESLSQMLLECKHFTDQERIGSCHHQNITEIKRFRLVG